MRDEGRSVQTGPGSGGKYIVPIDSLMDRRRDSRSQGTKTKKNKKKKKGKVREKERERESHQNQRLIIIHGSVAVKWWGV